DPTIEWNNGNWPRNAFGFYDEARLDGNVLVLRGGVADADDQPRFHDIEQRISIAPGGVIRVRVTDTVGAGSEVQLSKLMTTVYFTPDDRSSRGCEPLDFAWIPNLHWEYDDVVADHVFRSPAAIVQFQGVYAALVPDIDLLAQARPIIRHALDLRSAGIPTPEDPHSEWRCTRMQYGFCTWEPYLHVYYKHNQAMAQNVTAGPLTYGFDLFIGHEEGPEKVTSRVNRHLWKRYGRKHFKDIRPQVMPFEEYGRQYAYKYELPMDLAWVTLEGKKCAGITGGRRGANFHAWE
ncbi:MAG: hypothetical protein GY851_18700, partial [bacterium]|nr:hypothetical protein [bacterium]